MKAFTHYWRSDTWAGYAGTSIPYSAGNGLKKRGLSLGDRVFIVTNLDGQLFVGGYLDVARIVDRTEARRLMGRDVWEAEEFAIPAGEDIFRVGLAVPMDVTRKLRFEPGDKPLLLKRGRLDQQTLRGLRELTRASATMLADVLGIAGNSEIEKPFPDGALRNALSGAWSEASDTERSLVRAHHALRDHTGSAQDIARAAGFPSYQSSNAHYGSFARRVAERLGYRPGEWLTTLVTALDHNDAGHRLLQMDEGVVRALEESGLVAKTVTAHGAGLPDGVTATDLRNAIKRLDNGESHRFSDSTKYDVLFKGRRYPPKAVVGLAAERVAGRSFGPDDFSGGIDSKCFRILKEARFDVVPKPAVDPAEWDDDLAESEILQRTQIGPTEKERLIMARRGQGIFRENVLKLERRCRVTGVSEEPHLRASHMKPWKASDDREKLDGSNGLLLAPHVDHLFDRGYISFEDDGTLLVAGNLDRRVLEAWGVSPSTNVGSFRREQLQYLRYHRLHVFDKQRKSR